MAVTSPDVASSLTSSAVLAADLIPLFIKERTLMLSERQLIFYQFGDREMLPEGQGKTIQFSRYERLVLPVTPITEGVTPTSQQLTTAIVQAIVDQWAAVVSLTDVGILTVRHPVMRIAQDRISTQHSETVDREIELVLNGGTNVTFANGRTARQSLVAGDVPTTDLVRQIVSNLRQQGAPPMEGGHYVGCVDPFTEMDLTKDATFVNAASYSNIRALYNGEAGMWMGVRWVRSNFLPIITYLQSRAGTSTGDANFTQAGAGAGFADTGSVLTYATDTTTAAPAGTTKFAASGTVTIEATRLDPQSGQEVLVGAAVTLPNPGSAFIIRVGAGASYVAGTYNLYLSLQGSAVPLYQVTITPGAVTGSNTVPPTLAIFVLSGTQNATPGTGANAPVFVDQALGAVAPPPAPQVGSAGGPNVHRGYVFGREAFGVVDLGGLTTTLTPATATDSDPLIQRRKLGWKQLFKAVIKNPNFFSRWESLSAFN